MVNRVRVEVKQLQLNDRVFFTGGANSIAGSHSVAVSRGVEQQQADVKKQKGLRCESDGGRCREMGCGQEIS